MAAPPAPSAADPLGGAAAVAAAEALVPFLRAEDPVAEQQGRLTDGMVDALRAAGLTSLSVPRRWGGQEADVRSTVAAFTALARGSGAAAWVAMILSGGGAMAALLDEDGCADIWEATPGADVASTVYPLGTGRLVPGGLVVSGRWAPVSGVLHAAWVLVCVPTPGGQDSQDATLAVLAAHEITVEETWDAAGLQGSGSHTVVADEVFVPQRRLLPLRELLDGSRSWSHPDEPLRAVSLSALIGATLGGVSLGLAEAALELTLAALSGTGSPTLRRSAAAAGSQVDLAEAASSVDSARLQLDRAVGDVEAALVRGRQLDDGQVARVLMDTWQVSRRCREAVELLMTAGGAGSFARSDPRQRIWRDLAAASRHPSLVRGPRERYARALLGPGAPAAG